MKVARYGGISQAVRQMPHSIQQSTLSEHMTQLESELGTRLFVRQPFQLLESGRELLRVAGRFFDELAPLVNRLRDRHAHFRMAATELIRPEDLSQLISRLQNGHPGLHCSLCLGRWPELGDALRSGTIDLAFAVRSEDEPAGLSSRDIAELPLALLVPAGSAIRDPETLWRTRLVTERLVSPGPAHGVTQAFTRGLRLGSIQWRPTIEVDSLGRVAELVAAGAGFGVGVLAPWLVRRTGLRVLPLKGFQPVRVAALWKHPAPEIVRALVECF